MIVKKHHFGMKKIFKYNIDSKSFDLDEKYEYLSVINDNTYFPQLNTLTLVNPCGVNNDHRGSDHTTIQLDFHSSITLQHPIRFSDILDAAFRVKSHKFENWYELFCKAKATRKVETCNKGQYTVTLIYDHGS